MRKTRTKILLYLFLLMGTMVSLSSCHKDDDVEAPAPEPTKPTTYTIMLYGCGGGDLDDCLDYNLSQIDAYGKTDRINFTGLVKFSSPLQGEKSTEGTRLYTLTSEGLKNEEFSDAEYRLDNPANLAQFIKDSKEKMPADKYVLIFWNHGQEFGLYDEPYENKAKARSNSRSILFDDNVNDQSLSLYDIEKGIKDSGTKLDLIYMDLCNYGMAEVYYQLKDCAKYMMAASAPTPGTGANYSELMEDLQGNDSLEDAIKEYVPNCVKNWKNAGDGKTQEDLECYDLSYMDEFAGYLKSAMGEFNNILKTAEKEQKEKYDPLYNGLVYGYTYGLYTGCTDQLFTFYGYKYSVDVCSAFTRMAGQTLNGNVSYYATMMKRVLEKMTVAQAANNLPSWMDAVSMGIMWPTNSFIKYYQKEKSKTLTDNLKNAALYNATGWGDILANSSFHGTTSATSNLGRPVYLDDQNKYEYKYTWQYEITVDWESVMTEDIEGCKLLIEKAVSSFNESAKKNPSYLCMGKYSLEEALDYLANEGTRSVPAVLYNGYHINKMKIKVYTTDTVNPSDPFKDKYPTEIEEEIDLKDYLKKHNI